MKKIILSLVFALSFSVRAHDMPGVATGQVIVAENPSYKYGAKASNTVGIGEEAATMLYNDMTQPLQVINADDGSIFKIGKNMQCMQYPPKYGARHECHLWIDKKTGAAAEIEKDEAEINSVTQ